MSKYKKLRDAGIRVVVDGYKDRVLLVDGDYEGDLSTAEIGDAGVHHIIRVSDLSTFVETALDAMDNNETDVDHWLGQFPSEAAGGEADKFGFGDEDDEEEEGDEDEEDEDWDDWNDEEEDEEEEEEEEEEEGEE